MKVYLNYAGDASHSELKLKLTLPEKWLDGPVQKVTEFFVKQYNSKFPENILDTSQLVLQNKQGQTFQDSSKVSGCITEYADVLVVERPAVKLSTTDLPAGSPHGLQCKNLGCQKWFLEKENHDGACQYHSGAPVFHDLAKYWSCCPGKKAFDWEEFQALPTCATGRHCVEQKVQLFKPSEEIASPAIPAPLTPEEVAAAEAPPVAPQKGDKPGPVVDGKATCRNKGCGKPFVVAENSDEACVFHSGVPIFHDASKYWSCCSQKKCWDWDEFMAVPGCTKGPHLV